MLNLNLTHWAFKLDYYYNIFFTNKVFHHLWVVAMKDGCGEPADVELDISLSCLDVLLVADVHRLAPVSRQGDAN